MYYNDDDNDDYDDYDDGTCDYHSSLLSDYKHSFGLVSYFFSSLYEFFTSYLGLISFIIA